MVTDPRDILVTPLDRAQARIALDRAKRQLTGRRDLRTEIRNTAIAKYVEARQQALAEPPKESIFQAQREFKVSERTVRAAIRANVAK
jgi:hypothetical protein